MLVLVGCANGEGPRFENEFPTSQLEGYGIEEHRFFDVTMEEALALREVEDFDGILYFGFPQCPWCQAAVPILNDAALEAGIDVFYVSRDPEIREIGDWSEWDLEMANWLDAQLEMRWIYEEDEDGESVPVRPNIFVPHVIHLRSGEVIDHHRGTLDGHERLEDGTLPDLEPAEVAALFTIYSRIFSGVQTDGECPLTQETESCS